MMDVIDFLDVACSLIHLACLMSAAWQEFRDHRIFGNAV